MSIMMARHCLVFVMACLLEACNSIELSHGDPHNCAVQGLMNAGSESYHNANHTGCLPLAAFHTNNAQSPPMRVTTQWRPDDEQSRNGSQAGCLRLAHRLCRTITRLFRNPQISHTLLDPSLPSLCSPIALTLHGKRDSDNEIMVLSRGTQSNEVYCFPEYALIREYTAGVLSGDIRSGYSGLAYLQCTTMGPA